MKKSIRRFSLHTRPTRLFYEWILPGTTIIFLIFISGSTVRPLFLNSIFLDFAARLWLCFVFGMGSFIVSDLNRYKKWFYSGAKIEDRRAHYDVITILWNIVMGIMFGVFIMFISKWAIRTFLPDLNNIGLALAILYGIILSLPILYQSKRFSL